jgi:hypothetical protein
MASELKAETLKKKLLAVETLPEFLARMTLVWEERQRRLAEAPARASAASRRSRQKRLEADPEGVRAREREAQRRYEATNRKALRAREARRRERLAAALAVAGALKRAEQQAQREADKARKEAGRAAKRGYGGHAPHGDEPRGNRGSSRTHHAVWDGAQRSGESPKRARSERQPSPPAVADQSALSRAWLGQATGAHRALKDGCSAVPASVGAAVELSGLGRRAAKRRESQKSAAVGETSPPLARLLALD